MKVLIVCTAYPPDIKGGGEISTQILAESLVLSGIEVVVLTIGEKQSERESNGVRIFRIVSPNIYWSFNSDIQPTFKKVIWHALESFGLSSAYLEKILEDEKPNIVHTSTIEDFSPAVWEACRRLKVPVIHTLRSYTLMCIKATMFSKEKNCDGICAVCKAFSHRKRFKSSAVNGVVGISKFILARHLKHGFFENALSEVIPNPVEDGGPVVTRTEQRLAIGFLGRLTPEKGVECLLRAMTLIRRTDVDVLIAGRGSEEYQNRLRALASNLPVSFVGWCEAGELLSKIDILVVPSRWNEPFGRIVAEAFSFGRPVMASGVGGLPELITEGINGFIFNVNDARELAQKIEMLDVCNLRAMKEDCLKAAMSFDRNRIATNYIEFYKSVISAEKGKEELPST